MVSDLNYKELQAIQMRYLGRPSPEIAEATGYEESYVRRLFMQGGRLERAYSEYSLQQQEETRAVANAVLERAKTEAKQAIERVIELSKNPCQPAVCLKANEFLLSLIGLSQDTSIRSMLQRMSFEEAKKKVDEIFQDLFGQSIDTANRLVVFRSSAHKCHHCGELNPEKEANPDDLKKLIAVTKDILGTSHNP